MDEYPAGSLDHSVPFLLTLGTSGDITYQSGLSAVLKKQAILIRSELPALDSDQAHALLRYIQNRDASDLPCNGRDAPKKHRFRVQTAERSILLPPRRARLPDGIDMPSPTAVLHSPYSPLSPVSPLYPDGLIDTQWIRKHQDLIPSVLLCFYTLSSDPTLATLNDNKIKTDVNNIRGLLSQSGYKTRLAVVLLSDKTSPSGDHVQDRLESLRRGCGIDAKSLFLVPPGHSKEELERMAENMLTTLYTASLEYYRDLGRHSRKKRGRGVAPQPTVPPTSGTSQTLSLAGWNVRYDFKSAIFAEYRQEMDVALRSYEQAYENLLSSELMEVIPSWSPRWNEARFLADVLAVRCLRCLLWNGQHSAAARRWQLHRERIADFLDRRGRGTGNYGWEAWESRWALIMANLIEKASIPDFAPVTHKLYLQPEKNVMGERLQPWEFLHHTGYWYRLSAKHMQARRDFAHAIPEDDRRSPSMSPASFVAKSAFAYDNYMCPDPYEEYPLHHGGVDHGRFVVERLMKARTEFLKREQVRLAAEVSLECARELGLAEEWSGIVKLLRPLWKDLPFRSEGWATIAELLSWNLRAAAVELDDAELVLTIDWELLNQAFQKRPNWEYDITKSLDQIDTEFKPIVSIADGQVLPFISTTFLFREEEGKAGQNVRSQLAIKSNAHQGSASVSLSSLYINFTGSLDRIVIQHEDGATVQEKKGNTTVFAVPLTSDDAEAEVTDLGATSKSVILRGTADLSLSPGQTLVFNLEVSLREPGETEAQSLVVNLDTEEFDLHNELKFHQTPKTNFWYLSGSATKRIVRPNPLVIKVQPRPPKLEVKCPVWKDQYYTDETINLEFGLTNGEDIEALAKLDATLFGENPPAFTVDVAGHESQISSSFRSEESKLIGAPLGAIGSSKTSSVQLRLPPVDRSSQYDLTLKVTYFLPTNPGTPITQTATFQLNIVNPFEANYDLLPRVHPDPWPSLFDADGVRSAAPDDDIPLAFKGLSQSWCLLTRYASFASEPLRVVDIDVMLSSLPSVRCHAIKHNNLPPSGEGRLVEPKTIEEAAFELKAQKASLDERGPSPLDVSLVIKWSRPEVSEQVNSTTLPVPRFNLFGTEPRVLATVSHMFTPHPLVVLTVYIENASNHLLTFGLTMEPSEEFAFSGPKQTSLSLLPVQRRMVEYRLVPFDDQEEEGRWVGVGLVVKDKYYQKVLRVVPGGEGVRGTKEGVVEVWIPGQKEIEGEEGEGE
ncbi:Gryzun, putative trafficking through golgi-domain-containing protein [Triangularia setosa]|uniref:Gryzun, putative trafficking through golgi-domain-containing protein n=1 Tax=Triangularia setosa TaxID=2587417 RepID=A0AAN7A7Q4_9PEZI|nr:Gryzun, putative trafficking through golgi-domain-containing protein [Podospora setosa]